MGSLLKSFSRLERIYYWVSGLEPARIEACVRHVPQRFLEAAKSILEALDPETDPWLKQTILGCFAICPQNGTKRSDLHKDELEEHLYTILLTNLLT